MKNLRFTKISFAVLLILGSLHFYSCGGGTQPKSPAGNTDSKTTVEGAFRSVEAVMDELSCHCNKGGYIKDGEGKSTAVCFKETGMPEGDCANIKVEGIFEISKNNPAPTSPCPKGEFKILMVSKYSCK